MAHLKPEDAVDPVDRLVLGDAQPTDIPLKLREGVGRKHRREKRGVVTHDFRNFDQRQHKNTSRGRTRPFRGGILLRFFSRKRNKSSRSCCTSRVSLTLLESYQGLPGNVKLRESPLSAKDLLIRGHAEWRQSNFICRHGHHRYRVKEFPPRRQRQRAQLAYNERSAMGMTFAPHQRMRT